MKANKTLNNTSPKCYPNYHRRQVKQHVCIQEPSINLLWNKFKRFTSHNVWTNTSSYDKGLQSLLHARETGEEQQLFTQNLASVSFNILSNLSIGNRGNCSLFPFSMPVTTLWTDVLPLLMISFLPWSVLVYLVFFFWKPLHTF